MFFTVLKVFTIKNNINVNETVIKREDSTFLKLMYITNDKIIAKIAEDSGVDWIFIDLEVIGKQDRQGHLDTVISHHKIEDVKNIKETINKAKVIVRINPIYRGSEEEINEVIRGGADIIMLPFFKTKKEVEEFVHYTKGNVKTCLLIETPEAVKNIDKILSVPGIDYVYIGLNDLHIGYKKIFMFSLLADGTVEALCNKFRKKGIPYGFGGIARLGHGMLPAEYIIREFYRLGSSMVILSRSFCNASRVESYETIEKVFKEGVQEIRRFEEKISKKDYLYFLKSQRILRKKVSEIEKNMEKGREVI
ncbi:MAG TPA: aldolase [Clostridiales bacterium]|nr:aldolase [Clostridiales bacterium]